MFDINLPEIPLSTIVALGVFVLLVLRLLLGYFFG